MKLLLLIMILYSSALYAQKELSYDIIDDSRVLRGQLTTDLQPLSTLIVPSFGFSFGTYITNRNLVEFHYTKGSVTLETLLMRSGAREKLNLTGDPQLDGEIKDVYQDITRTDITHTLIAARHSFFLTNEFYIKWGAGLKKYAVEYPISEISQYEDLSALIEVAKPIISIGIGHRWVIKHFILRMEWINATYPFTRLKKAINYPSGSFIEKYDHFTNKIIYSAFELSTGVIF